MRLRAHDQGFVSASPGAVYATLADPSTYERWWPGASGSDGTVRLRLGRATIDARPEGHREGLGLYLNGDRGSVEWYLEPFEEGTIVNAFSDLELSGGPRRALRRQHAARSSIHSALLRLKLSLEGGP